jgi:hypothetical protein
MGQILSQFMPDGYALGVFLLVTVGLGGSAAALTGRAVAATWQPWWHTLGFMLLIGAAVRFLHFALFDATLLSPALYAADTIVCLLCGLTGFRLKRVAQMVTCYPWINERAEFCSWRQRASDTAGRSYESG